MTQQPDPALDAALVDALRAELPDVSQHVVAAITAQVPGYAGALSGAMGDTISRAVEMALAGFLQVAARPGGRRSDPGTPPAPAIDGAYALGQGEARAGRSADALLAAYRLGARVAWNELASTAVARGLGAQTLASFAGLVFAYIDELSAASVSGHGDELASSGRARRRDLERLSRLLLEGAPSDALAAAAERADWTVPGSLTAVLLPESQLRTVLAVLDSHTLRPEDDLADDGPAALLVPDAHGPARTVLLRTLDQRGAVVGPPRPWHQVRASYRRAQRARDLLGARPRGVLDTEEHLAALVLGADADALADLRARALAPLESVRPASRERLVQTLRAWLLHQGRRDEVAAALFVHPQTVRYRMGRLRELYGDRLEDPATVLDLTLALGAGEPPVSTG